MSVEDIQAALDNIFALLKDVNPGVRIITTVSPVRHLKDGFTENALSKAHLITSLHEVVEPRNHIFYFPSYEIMMDELRDYRFYKEDMVHPSALAVSHIWERFSDNWISEESKQVMKDVDVVKKGLQHRPFNPNSEAHQKFLKDLGERMERLKKDWPFFNFNPSV